jgi:hypothetical protein
MGQEVRRAWPSKEEDMNPAVSALIADYFEVPEVEADGLLIHLRINGWIVVAIQEDEPEHDE